MANPHNTSDVLTRAADAAGKAAAAAQFNAPWYTTADAAQDGFPEADARLIAASGPAHWRTVEALLRAGLALHPHTTGDDGGVPVCATCVNLGEPDTWPCATLGALQPLAEQALRNLEEAL